MSPVNEVQFVADIKSWIDEFCRKQPAAFPFSGASIEDRQVGKLKRKDLVVYDRQGKKRLTGEFKLPDKPDGRTPFDAALVEDAHGKADAEGVQYFFTSNINRTVLWETFRVDTPLIDRQVEVYDWDDISDSEELARPEVKDRLRTKILAFIAGYAEIYTHAREFRPLPLDRRFVKLLDSSLDGPRNLSQTVITRMASSQRRFREQVRRWVAKNLGEEHGEDKLDDLCKSAARFSCYILALKILFYDALKRKHGSLPSLVTVRAKTAEDFRARLTKYFRKAEEVSGDYETVFRSDELGQSLPLMDDVLVGAWRHLIEQVERYEITKIEYAIIGEIFERLLSQEERHAYGQHYTKSEIVDLINAFAIRRPEDIVIDPACGGGTFLVRAYARKRWLEERARAPRDHESRLTELYGVDISVYAAQLSVVSLATRDLGRLANYPRIACDDFFDVRQSVKAFPAGIVRQGALSKVESVALENANCVVGNPPYIRQELIEAQNKKKYAAIVKQEWPGLKLSGRSDLHVYFWPHAAFFLPQKDGYFGFLTSSSWLDVEYGFPLQRWILENFCIEAILESSVEPWFTGARVATAVAILRREPDLKTRMNNLVRFVQIHRPLDDIYMDIRVAGDSIEAAERLRERILQTKRDTETKDWRIRVRKQRDLIEGDDKENPSHHTGGKWGIPLRAPDIYFELMDRFGDKFIALSKIAEIRRGITSGCDAFFFPRDVTDQEIERLGKAGFEKKWHIPVKDTRRVRLCQSGDGSQHLIEAEYLQPEVHSLMEIDSPIVDPSRLSRKILLVSKPKSELKGTYVLKYITYGEKNPMGSEKTGTDKVPVSEKVTVKARESENKTWYDLSSEFRGDILWPMAQKYRHVAPLNSPHLICNHNLFDLKPLTGIAPELLASVLNTSILALVKSQFGRWAGTEATLKTEVVDVNMMEVPDPRRFGSADSKRLIVAFDKLSALKTDWLIRELDRPERRELDLALLQAMGASTSEAGLLLTKLHDQLRDFYAVARETEKQAQYNRGRGGRDGDDAPRRSVKGRWKISDESTPEEV